jgi:two-component system sensor kinase FixL
MVSTVVVDRVQIQQVVANLVRNSLQAMRDQPRREMTIATRGNGEDMLEVTVTDSGPGVEEKFRKKLFEAFQSTKPGGMGLGLSICRSIVEAHGGKVQHEPAFGGGATFSFTVPAALEPVA